MDPAEGPASSSYNAHTRVKSCLIRGTLESVGSLPLAHNAKHSPSSDTSSCVSVWAQRSPVCMSAGFISGGGGGGGDKGNFTPPWKCLAPPPPPPPPPRTLIIFAQSPLKFLSRIPDDCTMYVCTVHVILSSASKSKPVEEPADKEKESRAAPADQFQDSAPTTPTKTEKEKKEKTSKKKEKSSKGAPNLPPVEAKPPPGPLVALGRRDKPLKRPRSVERENCPPLSLTHPDLPCQLYTSSYKLSFTLCMYCVCVSILYIHHSCWTLPYSLWRLSCALAFSLSR